jgi:hypothetical protein
MSTFQAWSDLKYFRHDCGVNISCKPHVLQTDLFLKKNFRIFNVIYNTYYLFIRFDAAM